MNFPAPSTAGNLRSRLNLNTRGLLLVAVPLIFQILFMSAMIILLLFEKQAAAEEDRRKEIIGLSEVIAIVAGEAIQSVLMASKLENSGDTETVSKRLDAVKGQVNTVCNLIARDPQQSENIAEMYKSTEQFSGLLRKFHDEGGYHTRKAQAQLQAEGVEVASSYINVTRRINEYELQKWRQSESEKEIWRTWLKNCLLLATAASIAAAVVLARIYVVSIRKPMTQLMENTRRLSSRQELLPPLEGDDELARLDKFLHEVLKSIDEARRREIALVENAADMICSLSREGVFQKLNPYCKNLLGYQSDELLGKSIIDIATPEACAEIDARISSAVTSSSMQSLDVQLKTKDGDIIDCLYSSYWSPRDDQLFCVIHDVTEEKKLERLKEEFMSMVSHDLRSPLTSLLSRLTLLTNGVYGDIPDQATDEVMNAEQNCRRLIDLINDLLEFEKLQSGKLQINATSCAVKALAADSVQMIESMAESRNISIDLEGERFEIECDGGRIRQVIVNLLANAIKFSPDRSNIIVRWKKTDNEVMFEVIDEGPGLPPETHETVFSAFEQLANQDQSQLDGTRLGLSICKMIVAGHCGEIGLRNNPDKGSTIWFTLPLKKSGQ